MNSKCNTIIMNYMWETCTCNRHQVCTTCNCVAHWIFFSRLDVQDMQLKLSWMKCATQLFSLLCLRSHMNSTWKTCTCNCHELNVARNCISLHVYDMTVRMIFMITITIIHVSFAEYRLFYRALLQKRPIIYITVGMIPMITITMGWLRSVGSIKLYVSFQSATQS